MEVRRRPRRNLREVGDAKHLELRAQIAELHADDVRYSPTDAGVDFVKDQRA